MSTTTPEQWLALAERAEKATGADGDLSAAIWAGATSLPTTWISNPLYGDPYWETVNFYYEDGSPDYMPVPDLTASLDAITALIEREFPNSEWRVLRFAICAVFCRAMAERVLSTSPLKGET